MLTSNITPLYTSHRELTTESQPIASLDSIAGIEKVVIGNATIYRANCFNVLSELADIDAVVTDPPFGIGFKYRSYDDAPGKYGELMSRLVPELVRITANGP